MDPILGSYLDGEPNGGIYIPGVLNLYAYSINNPVRYKDDNGEFVNFLVGAAIGFAGDVALQATIQVVSGQEVDINWGEAATSAALGAVGGAGVAKIAQKGKKLYGAYKKAQKTKKAQAAMKRGQDSEKVILKKYGLDKNKSKVSSKEGNAIPDAITDKRLIEIKDSKKVTNTKQMRIQAEAAKEAGLKPTLITGKNSQVSKSVEKSFEIIRDETLGP